MRSDETFVLEETRWHMACYAKACGEVTRTPVFCCEGGEGSCRPPSATPSALQHKRQQQVPQAAAKLAQHYGAGKTNAMLPLSQFAGTPVHGILAVVPTIAQRTT
jgi:hypothetical protein